MPFLAEQTIAFGDVQASHTAVGLSSKTPFTKIRIRSTLDEEVVISFDGGTTDHLSIPAGNSTPYEWPIDFRPPETLDITMKYSADPSAGAITFHGQTI